MPIYVYECKNCGHGFEKLQSFNDEPIRVCPDCGGETRRVFQPVGVIFKGHGWYKTDSRKPDASEAGTSAPSKTESTSTDSSKSDSPAQEKSAKSDSAKQGKPSDTAAHTPTESKTQSVQHET